MPFIFHGQNIDFSKDVKKQIESAPPVVQKSIEEPVVTKKANVNSINELFSKTEDQKLKEIAAARPILKNEDVVITKTLSAEEKKIPNYEVHKDVVLVRNPKKLAKRSQYLNDLLSFENK